MDKFGIFKLLNCFLGGNGGKTESDVSPSAQEKPDFLSSLSTLLSNGQDNKNAKPQKSADADEVKTASPPLQSKMLCTMTSHDEFIKRVMKNNPN